MAKNKLKKDAEVAEVRNAPVASIAMTHKGLYYKLSLFEDKDKVSKLFYTISDKKKVLVEKEMKPSFE